MAKKKKKKEASEIVLDTSGLRPCASFSALRDEESFCGEYIRYSHTATRSIMEDDKKNRKPKFSVESDGNDQSAVKVINAFYKELSGRICNHMHEYLLENGGKVTRWAVPEENWVFSFSKKGHEFCYDYFAAPYEFKRGRITRPANRVFHNYYHYVERDPDLLTKQLENKFHDEHDKSEFLKEENEALEIVRSELKEARDKNEVITGAKERLILVFAMVLLAGLATACGFGLPLDLPAAANALTGLFSKAWSSLPVVLNFIVCAVMAIPLYVVVIALGFTDGVGGILLAAGQFGSVWLNGSLAVLWGAVLVASLFLGVNCVFWKNPLPAVQKKYDEANAALEKKKAEYARMEEEFRATDSYQKAKARDKRETEADQLNKAANERFAEIWQRAWFEAVKDQE